jgi:hypothetical protein
MTFEQHTTARCSLTREHLYRHAPIIVGTHVEFAAEILQAEICGCAGYARLYAWLGARSVAMSRETARHWAFSMFSQLNDYPPCVLRPAAYSAAIPGMAYRVH